MLWGNWGSGSSVWLCLVQHSSGMRQSPGSLCWPRAGGHPPGRPLQWGETENNTAGLLALHSLAVRVRELSRSNQSRVWRFILCPPVPPGCSRSCSQPGHRVGTWQSSVSRGFGHLWEFVSAAPYCCIES